MFYSFFHQLEAGGEILDVVLDFAAVGNLDADIGKRLPLSVVFATVAEPEGVGVSLRTSAGTDRATVRRLQPGFPGRGEC